MSLDNISFVPSSLHIREKLTRGSNKVMERLGEDEIFCIYEQITDREDKKSFSIACKQFLKVACFHLRSLHTKSPDLLFDILITSPKMLTFECDEPFSNNHMKLIAESCPNIEHLNLSRWYYLDHGMDKLEFDDVGLRAITNVCIHLVHVDLSGRLCFKEIGIGSLVRSCKNLRHLMLGNCINVTDISLNMIGSEATHLEKLDLGGCSLITDLGLKYLANGDLKCSLIKLLLNRCNRITNSGILHLKKLVSLKTLGLSRCGDNITDQGLVALSELPNLERLYLDFLINITNISLLEIGRKCLNISVINLEGCNRITGAGLRAFSGHPHLARLVLFSCYKISWDDVESIVLTCPNLVHLGLCWRIKKQMRNLKHRGVMAKVTDFNINGRHCEILWDC